MLPACLDNSARFTAAQAESANIETFKSKSTKCCLRPDWSPCIIIRDDWGKSKQFIWVASVDLI